MTAGLVPIVLLDGGLGTTLTEPPYNQHFDQKTPLWSSHLLYDGTETLRAAQSDFARAGTDILLTATYQASFEGFKSTLRNRMHAGDVRKHRPALLSREATEYMRSAIPIAKDALEARSTRRQEVAAPFALPAIALALGPLGATLVPSQEYTGEYPPEKDSQQALKEWHAERIEAFSKDPESWNAVEFVAFETFKRTDEVKAVREVMTSVRSGPDAAAPATQHNEQLTAKKKWWISTVWPNETKDEEVQAMVEAMLQNKPESTGRSDTGSADQPLATPWAIGVNCTGIEKIQGLVRKMEACVTELADSGHWRSEWHSDPSEQAGLDEAERSSKARPWLVLYPDGAKGLHYDSKIMEWVHSDTSTDDGVEWYDALWKIAKEIRQRGNWAGIALGGCCKTGPSHISRLREYIDRDQLG